MKKTKSNFASVLKQWRGETSQRLAANSLDVSLATYRNWEQGRREPTAVAQSAVLLAIRRLETNETTNPDN